MFGWDNAIDLVGAGLNAWSSYQTNKTNKDIAKDNLDYQKEYNAEIFKREDNAVQRRVADLEAAGLSPVLAAGSAASAGGSTSAPQNNFKADYQTQTLNLLQNLLTVTKQMQDISTAKSNEALNLANAGFINGPKTQQVNNDIQMNILNGELTKQKTLYEVYHTKEAEANVKAIEKQIEHLDRQNQLLDVEIKKNNYQFDFDTRNGGSSNPSQVGKMTNEFVNYFGNASTSIVNYIKKLTNNVLRGTV